MACSCRPRAWGVCRPRWGSPSSRRSWRRSRRCSRWSATREVRRLPQRERLRVAAASHARIESPMLLRRALATVIVVGVLLRVVPAAAESYRWVDANGNVIYSDRPPRPEDMARPAAPAAAQPTGPATAATERLLDATGLKHQARLVA